MISVYKAYPPAPPIRRAEPSAAGTLPAMAFQFCEAVRSASAFGWYVYSPKDLSLLFDGRETFIHEDNTWMPLKAYTFEDEFRALWNDRAPEALRDCDPPYVSEAFGNGLVQIWTGYFVATQPGHSLLVRPLANIFDRSAFGVYEGIVRTDRFKPCPLFINLRLELTNTEIHISKDRPLFQMQVLPASLIETREIYDTAQTDLDITDPGFEWDGLHDTMRSVADRGVRQPGTYGAKVRKARKSAD